MHRATLVALLLPTLTFADDADKVIEKAIAVHAGTLARLEKVRNISYRMTGTVVTPQGDVKSNREMTLQAGPGVRMVYELDFGKGGVFITLAAQGTKGWRRNNREPADDLGAIEVSEVQAEAYGTSLAFLLPLTEPGVKLTLLPETKILESPALAVKVVMANKPDAVVSFDKASGLLRKVSFKASEAGIPLQKEMLFGDIKEFEGLRLPTRWIDFRDGRKMADWKVTDYRFADKPDAKVTAKP